jgi:hypothetical protein
MTRKKKVEWEHEWHLYSAGSITAALTFIAIQFSVGNSATIGAAFSVIVGTILFTSNNWKKLDAEIHKWCIFIAVALTLIPSLFVIKNRNK